MATRALEMSVELLEDSIMNGQCNFIDLKENLPNIMKLSKASVSHINSVKSFLNFNEEILVDLQARQTIEIISINNTLREVNQKKDQNIAETKRIKKEKENIQIQINAEQNKKQSFEEDSRKLSIEKYKQQMNLSKAEANLKTKMRTMKHNDDIKAKAEASMQQAKRIADEATARLQEAENYYARQKRLQREREERLAWSWIVPGYNVVTWVDAGMGARERDDARNYRDNVHHSYSQKKAYFRSAKSNYGYARNEYWAAVEHQRAARDRMDYLSSEVNHLSTQIKNKQLFITSAIQQRNQMIKNLASAQSKIASLLLQRNNLLTKMETIKNKMMALKEKNELVIKELDEVTKLRNTIVEVNIIIITVNAQLLHSQKMANGPFEWTRDNYEILDLVLIGIENALREMKIYELGDGVPNKILSRIKDCKRKSIFMLGLDDLDR